MSNNYLDTAITAAKNAGKELIHIQKNHLSFTYKSKHDILHEADLISEKIINDEINQSFPNHSVLTEEHPMDIGNSEYLWVIDPVDGTINYARGLDDYCVSIALLKNNEVILGLIYQPNDDKLYYAEKGKGAFLNKQKITVAKSSKPIDALGAVEITSKVPLRYEIFDIMKDIAKEVRQLRVYGTTSLCSVYLAEGKIDFYIKNRYNYWDIAAGKLIIEEAGGKVTNFKGEEVGFESDTYLASNGVLHEQILKILNKSYDYT
jgi:myo-inositol-1(or 4)-monophosphatase